MYTDNKFVNSLEREVVSVARTFSECYFFMIKRGLESQNFLIHYEKLAPTHSSSILKPPTIRVNFCELRCLSWSLENKKHYVSNRVKLFFNPNHVMSIGPPPLDIYFIK